MDNCRECAYWSRVDELYERARDDAFDQWQVKEDSFWGEPIYSYSRSQALSEGVLVDVSQVAKEAGFKYPTAITADLHARLTPDEREQAKGQSYNGRLWDVLWMASLGARKSREDRIAFDVLLAERNGSDRMKQNKLRLWAVIGPGDDASSVITIGFPEDF